MITLEPNPEAQQLTQYEELFQIERNKFSQFFGRILFGKEELYRRYFNSELIRWMHANGSRFPGDNGRNDIRTEVERSNFELIITFGIPAAKVIYKNISLDKLVEIAKDGKNRGELVKISENTYYAGFPHVSGNAQWCWEPIFSDYLILVQRKIQDIYGII